VLLVFKNGTNVQKELVREALAELLHFPLDSIGLSEWEIEFVADPDEGKSHNEFAITTYTYNSGEAVTRIRQDAPHFPEPWGGARFFKETVIHEFAHAVYANLAPGTRLQVAEMFGATTDDPKVIGNPAKLWEERVVEGIAETFKDAFLPQRFRRYANRTKRHLSLLRYQEFRELFRGSFGAGGFSYVYGSGAFRVDLSMWGLDRLPYHESNHDSEAFVFYQELLGFSPCWGVDMSQFKESGTMPFSIEPEGGITS
jgi:hypothetical protein